MTLVELLMVKNQIMILRALQCLLRVCDQEAHVHMLAADIAMPATTDDILKVLAEQLASNDLWTKAILDAGSR